MSLTQGHWEQGGQRSGRKEKALHSQASSVTTQLCCLLSGRSSLQRPRYWPQRGEWGVGRPCWCPTGRARPEVSFPVSLSGRTLGTHAWTGAADRLVGKISANISFSVKRHH